MRPIAFLLAVCAGGLAGCVSVPGFRCQTDEQCATSQGQGTCEREYGACSYEDGLCESGRSYGPGSGTLAGTCVGDEPIRPPDADGGPRPDGEVIDSLGDAVEVSPELFHACLLDDGQVACWGRNGSGELGNGGIGGSQATPVVVGDVEAIDVDTGYNFTCALEPSRTVLCWGEGSEGALGAEVDDSPIPREVLGVQDVDQMSVGGYSTCFLVDGVPYCWGSNFRGQAGVGTTEWSLPVTRVANLTGVSLIRVATTRDALFHGGQHVCAIKDGRLWCWGYNSQGNLGVGDTDEHLLPTEVPALTGVVDVQLSSFGGCALTDAGAVHCWGDNRVGQVGVDSPEDRLLTPVEVGGLPPIALLVAGADHHCALDVDGKAWCWGDNSAGQLGDGTAADRRAPVPIETLPPLEWLGAGGDVTCARALGGAIGCWGRMSLGDL